MGVFRTRSGVYLIFGVVVFLLGLVTTFFGSGYFSILILTGLIRIGLSIPGIVAYYREEREQSGRQMLNNYYGQTTPYHPYNQPPQPPQPGPFGYGGQPPQYPPVGRPGPGAPPPYYPPQPGQYPQGPQYPPQQYPQGPQYPPAQPYGPMSQPVPSRQQPNNDQRWDEPPAEHRQGR